MLYMLSTLEKTIVKSENPIPIIPKGCPVSPEGRLKAAVRAAQQEIRSLPKFIHLPRSSNDKRLRKVFNSECGLPLKKTEELLFDAIGDSETA